MRKFEALENYRKQESAMSHKRSEAQRKRDTALEAMQAAKADYSALVRRSVTESADLSDAIDKADEAVQKAERTFRRFDEEYNVSSAIHKNKADKDSIVDEWNRAYYPDVIMGELLTPLLDDLLAAGNAYADAFEKVLAAVEQAKAARTEAYTELGQGYEYKLRNIDTKSAGNPITSASITVEELRVLAQGKRPAKFNKGAK